MQKSSEKETAEGVKSTHGLEVEFDEIFKVFLKNKIIEIWNAILIILLFCILALFFGAIIYIVEKYEIIKAICIAIGIIMAFGIFCYWITENWKKAKNEVINKKEQP